MPTLKPSLLKSAEQAHLTHHVVLEAGTTIDDMLKPEYWKAAAAHLHPSDRIQVEAADGSFFAELSVRDVGKTWAKVKVCNEKRHEPDEEVSEDAWMQAFTVTPHHRGYVVKRNSDGT